MGSSKAQILHAADHVIPQQQQLTISFGYNDTRLSLLAGELGCGRAPDFSIQLTFAPILSLTPLKRTASKTS